MTQQNKIAFFGTSHTYGDCKEGVSAHEDFFKYLETPWPDIFAKKLDKDFYNFGVGGADNMTMLDTVLDAFSQGKMDDVDTVILEPRLTFDTVKVPYDNTGYERDWRKESRSPSMHWIDHARHTKISDPSMEMPLSERFWTRFALIDLKDTDAFNKRIRGTYKGSTYEKKLADEDIKKYVELDKLFVSHSKYLKYLNLQFIKNVYLLCKPNGIKFYWLNWEGFAWEKFTPFFEQDNNLMELNITPSKCVTSYMDKDVPGNLKDWQCSCGHFNQKAQDYIAEYLLQGYNERTNS